jgi:hypothetical protein
VQAAKIPIIIPEDRRIELDLPKDLPAGPAEVIILITARPGEARPGEGRARRPLGIDAGKGWIAEDFDAPLPDDIQAAFEGEQPEP